jgi:undecaprenol kinase
MQGLRNELYRAVRWLKTRAGRVELAFMSDIEESKKTPMKNQSFRRRAGFAIQGIFCAWRAEASFRQQAVIALGVLLILLWRRPAMVWWALLLMNCGLVLAAELFNTALEHALDHLHPERHAAIEVAKDCAAGAVLLLSLTGLCVFITFLASTWAA